MGVLFVIKDKHVSLLQGYPEVFCGFLESGLDFK